MTSTQSAWGKLKREWQREGPVGIAVWAANWTLWKTRAYYAMPLPMSENVQARLRYLRREKKYGIDQPIIVYQMGKVGSMSVYWSLMALALDVPIYHLHFLNDIEEHEKWLRAKRETEQESIRRTRTAYKLKREIDRGTAPRYNLISLVRTPVQHALSAYSHRLDLHYPEFRAQSSSNTLSAPALADYFIHHFHDDLPEQWFDRQVKNVFGLDVYAEPFPRERGYQVYENKNARLLVIRLEDLNRVSAEAVREFLHIPDLQLLRKNVGEDKAYGELYKELSASLRLPKEYIEKAHSTRYAQHFYTPQELEASVARWVAPRGQA